MIEKIISWSTHNRFFVWLGILLIIIGGIFAVVTTPVDAIPDISENQVRERETTMKSRFE